MRVHLGDPEIFCAMIGHRFTWAVHQPLQVLHVSATDTTIRHQNQDALDDFDASSGNHANHNGNSSAHRPKTVRMTEQGNPPKSAGAGDAAAGIPFYEKQRQHLKELIARKRALEKRLVLVPDAPGLLEKRLTNCHRPRKKSQSITRRPSTWRTPPRGISLRGSTAIPRALGMPLRPGGRRD